MEFLLKIKDVSEKRFLWERFFIYCGELEAGADKQALAADK
ncbi:hypothetical protein [Planomicrobium okeanokoites]|nr:hypothetical protein [Planomicrobium okeanokoites]